MILVTRRTNIARLAALTLLALAAAHPLSAQQRTPGSFFGAPTMSLATVAANEAVQKDLGLSADVVAKLRELREDYNAARIKEFQTANIDLQNFRELSEDQRGKASLKMAEITTALDDEFAPQVKAVITAAQLQRMEQIRVQANLRNLGPSALLAANLASELQLTAEQKTQLNELNAAYLQQRSELFRGGNPGGSTEALGKLRTETNAKVASLLTAEQQETLAKLKGPEFDVSQLGFGGRGRRGNN